jgi:aryl-alcohol dehydrogenase-like predicted oxidoreductase
LCRKYGISLQQLCLCWLLSQDQVTAITAMKNPAHLPGNLKTAGITLEPSDVERLRAEFPARCYISTVPLR